MTAFCSAAPTGSEISSPCAAAFDSPWPLEEPDFADEFPPEIDDDAPLELDEECWEALTPDDDYEPVPEFGDFWTEQAAA